MDADLNIAAVCAIARDPGEKCGLGPELTQVKTSRWKSLILLSTRVDYPVGLSVSVAARLRSNPCLDQRKPLKKRIIT